MLNMLSRDGLVLKKYTLNILENLCVYTIIYYYISSHNFKSSVLYNCTFLLIWIFVEKHQHKPHFIWV